MKKINSVKDITSGMLVTLRNGTKMTVVTTTVYGNMGSNMDKCRTGLSLYAPAVGEDGDDKYWPMSEYYSDFKCKYNEWAWRTGGEDIPDFMKVPLPDLDIVQVWSCTYPSNAFANTTEYRELLWSDPSYEAEGWDELTDEEKDAECSNHEDCDDCPYNNKGCDDYESDPEDEDEDEDEDEKYVATQLDELRDICAESHVMSILFASLADDLPEGHADYILGKTDKNPERKAAWNGNKSLAEQLYEHDKKLAAEGMSVLERDIALLAAMHSACGDHKD